MNKPLGVAVKGFIIKDNKILIIKRSPKSEFDPDLWDLPGGKISYGEVLSDALKREIEEEISLVVKVCIPIVTWHFIKEPYWVTGITFLCDYKSGSVCLSSEHVEYLWIDPHTYATYRWSTGIPEQFKSYLELKKYISL